MPRILVVEDEAAIARVLVDNLIYEGHEAEAVADGAEGLERALAIKPDLILLDVVLPTMDGYEVCRRLRARGSATPIIMLTARGEEVDKVLGLELGADDYVTKPVGVRELMARIKAVLRRGEPATAAGAVLEFGPARIDFDRHEATVDGRALCTCPPRPSGCCASCGRAGAAPSPGRRSSSRYGGTRSTPPRARWTTTSPNCGAAWRPTRRARATCSRYTGSATASWSRCLGRQARQYNLFAPP